MSTYFFPNLDFNTAPHARPDFSPHAPACVPLSQGGWVGLEAGGAASLLRVVAAARHGRGDLGRRSLERRTPSVAASAAREALALAWVGLGSDGPPRPEDSGHRTWPGRRLRRPRSCPGPAGHDTPATVLGPLEPDSVYWTIWGLTPSRPGSSILDQATPCGRRTCRRSEPHLPMGFAGRAACRRCPWGHSVR